MSRKAPDIARLDELLELLYWLEGEGIAGSGTPAEMARFLVWSEVDVQAALDRLVERRDLLAPGRAGGEFRFTERGRREAARRFNEDFSELLSQGHGECSDPDCECHDTAGAAECRGRQTHSH